jgi:hypothetical protein
LRSSDEQRAMQLREAHRQKVARNEVRASTLWARPARGYNVHIELDPPTRSALEKIQRSLYQAEPGLLVCPPKALHVSVAWLLAVHENYQVDKDTLWERNGGEWMAQLRRIAAESTAFRITYEHVVATDSAVIDLARPLRLHLRDARVRIHHAPRCSTPTSCSRPLREIQMAISATS